MSIPAETTSFVGRTALLAKAMELVNSTLRHHRLISLIGTGGVGKTRLLERLATEVRAAGTGRRIVIVRLTDLRSTDERLEAAIAEALGLGDNAAASQLARVISYLHDKQVLLLLDNCEHTIGAVKRLVTTLLRAVEGLKVVTTSRRPLNVEGENHIDVPSLCTGDAGDICETTCNGAEVHEAVRLLLDRTDAVGVKVTEADFPLAVRLCRMLDGLPLAIELVAARMKRHAMTLQEVVEHPSLLRLLIGGPSSLRHHRTLRAMLEWSYELLSEAARTMWALVSVFDGGFDREAAHAISADRFDEDTVSNLLTELVNNTLLVAEVRDGRTWFRMLTIIKQFGEELVAQQGQTTVLGQAHAEHFATFARRCADQCFGPDEIHILRRVGAHLPNLLLAQEHFVAQPEQQQRAAMLAIDTSTTRFAPFFGKLNEGRRMLATGLDALPEDPSLLQVGVLSAMAWTALIQGVQNTAAELLDRAENVARRLGGDFYDTFGPLLYARATRLWLAEPDFIRARQCFALFDQAATYFQRAGQRMNWYMVMLFKALAAAQLGDQELAYAESERILEKARAADAKWCISWALSTRAQTELRFGDPYEAALLAQEALSIQREIGDEWGPTWSLSLLASIAIALGEYELGAQMFGATRTGRKRTETRLVGLLPWLASQQRAEAAARGEIGDDQFEVELETGAGWPPEKAYTMALRPFAPRGESHPEVLPRGLTKREYQIAGEVAKGLTNSAIGDKLNISRRTVDAHIQSILRKLGVNRRLLIATWYAENPLPAVSPASAARD